MASRAFYMGFGLLALAGVVVSRKASASPSAAGFDLGLDFNLNDITFDNFMNFTGIGPSVGTQVDKAMTLPIGIRQNNPGNLRPSGDNWQGMTGDNNGYLVFSTPYHGLRALAKNLDTYRTKYGLNTISGIITRWAPDFENNTGAYIASVAEQTGLGRDDVLNNEDYIHVIKAIIVHENGWPSKYGLSQWYSDSDIQQAIDASGLMG